MARKLFRDPRPAPAPQVGDVLDDLFPPAPFDFSFPPTAYELMMAEHQKALESRHRFTRASLNLSHDEKVALHLSLFPKEN